VTLVGTFHYITVSIKDVTKIAHLEVFKMEQYAYSVIVLEKHERVKFIVKVVFKNLVLLTSRLEVFVLQNVVLHKLLLQMSVQTESHLV